MKTALVTGASYGIGASIAEALLQEGWKVYGLSRSEPKIKNERFVWLEGDLSQPDRINEALKAISEPKLDALISNAGVVIEEMASAVSLETYEKTFSVNVLAPMLLVSTLGDKIKHATIISISSVSDRLPAADIALYCSSKAANTLYFNALAKEWKNANVYTLLPDNTDTPMLHGLPPEDPEFSWEMAIQPADIAKLCSSLISKRTKLESGANIIIVTEALKTSFKSIEKLYGFNTDSNELTRL
jgi:NAD(P)-dependent dehydrogenase (short-subunit alcohol dehydrogenase family)